MSTETTEQKVPSKEQVIKFYEEQIEIAKLRRDLSELLAVTAKHDADRAESIAKQAHFSAPKPAGEQLPDGVVQHTVTQEDMDSNPELAEQGIKVGDVIGISAAPQVEELQVPTPDEEEEDDVPVRKLKKE